MNKQFTRNGIKFTVRRAKEDDAEGIIAYSRIVFDNTDQVLTTPEEYDMTVVEEKLWINSGLTNQAALILIAEVNGEVVGLLDFFPKAKKKIAHTGEFGISVHPNYQGMGIGGTMIEMLLHWALNHKQIEKVILNVLDTNTRAIKLYKELGFTEEGRQIKAVKQADGEYTDMIQMYFLTK